MADLFAPLGAGFFGIESFTPPWDVFFLPLFNGLVGLYRLIFSDLGLAIVALTVVIRTLLAPLFVRQIRSQKEMQRMAPLVREVQRKHKGNQRKIAEETQALYREHGVNPYGGCLPLFIQLPILIALYNALNRAASLVTFTPNPEQSTAFSELLTANPAIQSLGNHQFRIPFDGTCSVPADFQQFLPLNCQLIDPFKFHQPVDTTVGWLLGLDLARVDHVFAVSIFGLASISALAVLAAVLQFVQVKMTTPRTGGDDPTASVNQSMTYIFPIMTVVWGAVFPSGLLLYWIVYTAYLIGQQFLIMGWGNLFPLFGWQPGWAAPGEVGPVAAPRIPATHQSTDDARAPGRPADRVATGGRASNKRRRRREGRRR